MEKGLICSEASQFSLRSVPLPIVVILLVVRISGILSNSLLFASVFQKRDFHGINAYLFLNNAFFGIVASAVDPLVVFVVSFGGEMEELRFVAGLVILFCVVDLVFGLALFGLDRILAVLNASRNAPATTEGKLRVLVFILVAGIFALVPALFDGLRNSDVCVPGANFADLFIPICYRTAVVAISVALLASVYWAKRRSRALMENAEPGGGSLERKVRLRHLFACTAALSSLILACTLFLISTVIANTINRSLQLFLGPEQIPGARLACKTATLLSQSLLIFMHGVIGFVKMRTLPHHSSWVVMVKRANRRRHTVVENEGDFHFDILGKMWTAEKRRMASRNIAISVDEIDVGNLPGVTMQSAAFVKETGV